MVKVNHEARIQNTVILTYNFLGTTGGILFQDKNTHAANMGPEVKNNKTK